MHGSKAAAVETGRRDRFSLLSAEMPQGIRAMPDTNRVQTGKGLLLGAILLVFSGSLQVSAQYMVFSWDSFEGARVPDTLQMKFQASPETVGAVDYAAPTAPSGIRNGIAQVECGRYGIAFAPTPDRKFVAVVNPLTLNRQRLGTTGKALYQADFFLPPEGQEVPTLAVLAVARDEQNRQSIWRMYRFGVYRNDNLFFAYADGDKQKGTPVLTRVQPMSDLNLARPGWHRFQIVFRGQEDIVFAVDGKETNFSPVKEASLTELQAGIMVTNSEDHMQVCYADNLSIQWTPDDLALPDSPWTGGATAAAFTSASQTEPGGARSAGGGSGSGTGISWHASPESAWAECTTKKRPVLVLFYMKGARAYPALEQILTTDDSAQQLVSRFVPLRLDVNQLTGGSLAQKFNVFRVPAFLVVGENGTPKAQIVFDEKIQWPSVAAQLQQAMATP